MISSLTVIESGHSSAVRKIDFPSADFQLIKQLLNRPEETFWTKLFAQFPKTTVLFTLLLIGTPLLAALLHKVYLWATLKKVEQLCQELYRTATDVNVLNLQQQEIVKILMHRMSRAQKALNARRKDELSSAVCGVIRFLITKYSWIRESTVPPILIDYFPTVLPYLLPANSSEVAIPELDNEKEEPELPIREKEEPELPLRVKRERIEGPLEESVEEWAVRQDAEWRATRMDSSSSMSNLLRNLLRNLESAEKRCLEKSTENLILYSHQITIVPSAVLTYLAIHLQVLNLGSNQIAQFDENTFPELPHLKKLILSSNRIKELPTRGFYKLTFLKSLDLADNEICIWKIQCFQNLSCLKELNLSDNHISSIPPGGLEALSSLDELDLSDNELSSMPDDALDALSMLTDLHPRGNKIERFPQNILKRLSKLNYLDLGSNLIGELPEPIEGGSQLKYLRLKGNPLTKIAWTHLSLLSSLAVFVIEKGLVEKLRESLVPPEGHQQKIRLKYE
jgi:hypothetical protein